MAENFSFFTRAELDANKFYKKSRNRYRKDKKTESDKKGNVNSKLIAPLHHAIIRSQFCPFVAVVVCLNFVNLKGTTSN